MSGRGWDQSRLGPPPDPTGATLICWRLRPHHSTREHWLEPVAEFTDWSSVEEALAASELLSPCDEYCRRDHAIAFMDVDLGGRERIRIRRAPKRKRTRKAKERNPK